MMFRRAGMRVTRNRPGCLTSILKLSFVVVCGAAERPDAEDRKSVV
jgi:hypothetical protein